jgi:hypothetical protein
MRHLQWIFLDVGLCAVLVASSAAASDADPTVSEAKAAHGWIYSFDDDPLDAAAFGPAESRLNVLRHGRRETLIRPRAAFVNEMLKSVEALP